MSEKGYTIWDAIRRIDARLDKLHKLFMVQYARVEESRLTAYQDLDDRLDVLEEQIEAVMCRATAATQTCVMLERRLKALEASHTHEAGTTAQERFALAVSVAELEKVAQEVEDSVERIKALKRRLEEMT